MIKEGAIDILRNLIESKDHSMLKEVLWGCSNIAAGSYSQIEKLYYSGIPFRVMEIITIYRQENLFDKKTLKVSDY
jgi:hypothetical protein